MCTLGSRGILESQMFNKCKIFLGPSFQSFCLLDKSWVFCCCGSSSSWATTTAGAASSLSKAFWVFCLVIGTIENYTQNEENTHLGRSIGFPHPTLPYYTHIDIVVINSNPDFSASFRSRKKYESSSWKFKRYISKIKIVFNYHRKMLKYQM